MENQEQKSNSKPIIIVLSVLLASAVGYIFKLNNDNNVDKANFKTEISTVTTEKVELEKKLLELDQNYQDAVAKNETISEELKAEHEKAVSLLGQLRKSNGSVASLSKIKAEYNELKVKMDSLMAENQILSKQNESLKFKVDSTDYALKETTKNVEELNYKNASLSSLVEKASQLTLVNLKGTALNVKNSGKEIVSDKASRANVIRVSFTVAENQIASSGTKKYYIQVIDSQNNIIGDNKTEYFGEEFLTYSFISNFNFSNKTIDVVKDLAVSKLEKGTYFVNIFDKKSLVCKSSFMLK